MLLEFINFLGFAFGLTGPIFLLVFLGMALKACKLLDDIFVKEASKLVFRVAFPAMLFFNLVSTDILAVINGSLLGFGVLGTLLVVTFLSLAARLFVSQKKDRGVFIQGAFRGELLIIGLSFCHLVYGAEGLARASIYMSVMMFLYNFLSIYLLKVSLSDQGASLGGILVASLKNPIMVSILLGIVASLLAMPVPKAIQLAGDSLADMAFPLALICIGASLSLKEFKTSGSLSWIATGFKLIVAPFFMVSFAHYWKLDQVDIGIVYFMACGPTTVASYIMVQGIGGNAKLAANMVALSTLVSVLTISLGVALLKFMGVL